MAGRGNPLKTYAVVTVVAAKAITAALKDTMVIIGLVLVEMECSGSTISTFSRSKCKL